MANKTNIICILADATPANVKGFLQPIADVAAMVQVIARSQTRAPFFPLASQVAKGIAYGPVTGGEFAGTLSLGNAIYPNVGDVDAVAPKFGPNGSDYQGTLAQPAPDKVKQGTQYGAGGTEFTGTYQGGGVSRGRAVNA